MNRALLWLSLLVAAPAGAGAAPGAIGVTATNHWAFRKPVRPPVPALQGPGSKAPIPHPIDSFVLARLSREGVTPAPEADRTTLFRRVCLDLTGLPPAPTEVDAFLSDTAPDAYERAVERLLASPHYGERWGRWWLDAARYADSNGYSIDSFRSMWPYRDWVVRALNADLPFDTFTLWQLAGDLLPAEAPDSSRGQVETRNGQLETRDQDRFIATGFHRNTQVNHEGGIDTEQFRIESAVDRVNTTATVWLGLTLACAQCHDHKYDPVSQREYYQFFAFFNQQANDGHGSPALEAENTLDIGTPAQRAALATHRTELQRRERELTEWIEKELKPRQPAWEAALDGEAKKKLKPEVVATLPIAATNRNEFQAGTVFAAFRDQDKDYRDRRKTVDEFRQSQPKLPTTLVMREHGQPRETFTMIKGDFTRRGTAVDAGVPAVLTESRTSFLPSPKSSAISNRAQASENPIPNSSDSAQSGPGQNPTPSLTRVDLARWLVSPDNPLTARVTMNRVWQVYFGKGLVETENDFGRMGVPPSHPELLDWLATEFIARGWSLKAMHRLIVTSATYRQSSVTRPELVKIDPGNKLLARQSRLRLEAELIRDVQLAASSLLDARLGGPPVFPPQPEGLDAFTQNKREWKASAGGDRFRRALYTHVQRTRFHPALSVFDAPDAYVACTRRLRSNTPLQALTVLNDQAFVEFAQGFARRLQAQAGDDAVKIEFAFRCAVARPPADAEAARLRKLLEAERHAGTSEADAWLALARVLFNLDETITRE